VSEPLDLDIIERDWFHGDRCNRHIIPLLAEVRRLRVEHAALRGSLDRAVSDANRVLAENLALWAVAERAQRLANEDEQGNLLPLIDLLAALPPRPAAP
jgi:hypothetical protein